MHHILPIYRIPPHNSDALYIHICVYLRIYHLQPIATPGLLIRLRLCPVTLIITFLFAEQQSVYNFPQPLQLKNKARKKKHKGTSRKKKHVNIEYMYVCMYEYRSTKRSTSISNICMYV